MSTKAIQFVGITYGLSIALGLIIWQTGALDGRLAGTLAAVLYMFVPLTSAIIVQKVLHRDSLVAGLSLPPQRSWAWALAVLFPVALALLTGVAGLLLPETRWSPDSAGVLERLAGMMTPEQLAEAKAQIDALPVHPLILAVVSAIGAGCTINALAAFGEEAGWRGLLLRELRGLGFWKASFAIGTIWGLWHAPLILQGHNYSVHRIAGVFLFTVILALLTPWMVYVRYRTGSVVSAALFHGVFNASAGIPWMLVAGGGELDTGLTGYAAVITLVVLDLGLWAWLRGHPVEDRAA